MEARVCAAACADMQVHALNHAIHVKQLEEKNLRCAFAMTCGKNLSKMRIHAHNREVAQENVHHTHSTELTICTPKKTYTPLQLREKPCTLPVE
jgi:hypothetical protein